MVWVSVCVYVRTGSMAEQERVGMCVWVCAGQDRDRKKTKKQRNAK